MQIWEGQTGGEDEYMSAEGLSSLFCSRVLEELTRSSSPAFSPLPASLQSVKRQFQSLMTAEAGFSVPVRVCMSGSDHHSKLYTIHQHLWRS